MNNPNKETIQYNMARFLKNIRRQCGFSQEMLAERANLHRNTIAQIERGQKDMSIITLTKLFIALKLGNLHIENPQGRVHCDNKPSFVTCPSRNIIYKQIACGINFLRQSHDFSRETVYQNTGIHRNTIARIENAAHDIRFSTLGLLYLFFGINKVNCLAGNLCLSSKRTGTINISQMYYHTKTFPI